MPWLTISGGLAKGAHGWPEAFWGDDPARGRLRRLAEPVRGRLFASTLSMIGVRKSLYDTFSAFNWPEAPLASSLRGPQAPDLADDHIHAHIQPQISPIIPSLFLSPYPNLTTRNHFLLHNSPPQHTLVKNDSRHCDSPAIWSPVLSHQMDHRHPMAIPRRERPRIPPMAMATRKPGQRGTDTFPSLGEAAPFQNHHCVRNLLASKANTGSAMNASVARSNAMAKPHVSVVGISLSTASMLPTAVATHSRTQRRLLSPQSPHLCSLTNTILANSVRCAITSPPCRNRSMIFTPALATSETGRTPALTVPSTPISPKMALFATCPCPSPGRYLLSSPQNDPLRKPSLSSMALPVPCMA